MSSLLATAAAHHGFWASTLAMALVVVICAIVAGAAVAAILIRRSRPGGARERVAEFVAAASVESEHDAAVEPSRNSILTRTERSLERERWWDAFTAKLELAHIDRRPIEVIYLTLGCALAGAIVLIALTGTPVGALIAPVVAVLVARWVINWRLQRQRLSFADQLASHLQELAAAMRAGHSMVSGIAVMAENASEPTRGEFQRVIADEQLGMPLEEALRLVAKRMDAQDMQQVSLVAELHRQTGGNMSEVLDRVAEAVRSRAELSREMRTLTAQARGSRWVVTLIPPGLLGAISLINPTYLEPLFSTGTGNVLLVMAAGLMILGSVVMGRIVKIEV